ncbi:MAG TPA: tetratricopeptide repeat protein [Candidatus Paceibacterota bacterium]|nr:tetratricopeptide repeat protein [Verrucomicrobiota bacterium]HOX01504.1 tetratricopeptide repeat protein [Verrucomicrobiota bacterium]HRZ44242.1 tetratricopeptide repeat protein [Candidatus Paceibacterota bacterium]HRZ91886.1 tetratricopeptide repeat protein [Candidatus Paceibacterota bacterium]
MVRALLAVAGPVLVLGVLEVGLRLAGYGHRTSFFVPLDDGRMLASNRCFGWQFMPRQTATQPYPLVITAQKPAGQARIFILGESAAQGAPSPAFGFSRILEVMLSQQFPDWRFEVVNVAMRGINSHAVLPIARECARLGPDLCLVYLGNNETISIHAPDPERLNLTPYLGLLRFTQWMKGARLVQLGDRLVRALQAAPPRRSGQDMDFFRRKRLAADDPRRQAVYDNFRANLEEICRAIRASGAPVIVSTVAVNLSDFPPLASLHRTGLAPAELAAWQSAFAQGANAEAEGRLADALARHREAVRVDGHFAELHFRLARCELAAGQREAAAEHFSLARDWDALQFRADRRINQIIRDTAASRRDPGVILLDAERSFAQAAGPDAGGPGNRFFHEHVHLNFEGDYLLARLFFPLVARALNLASSPPPAGEPPPIPSRQECADALAFTEWDEIGVAAAMARLTAGPPFLDQIEHASRQARVEQELERRGQRFQQTGGFPRVVAVYRSATARRPEDWQLRFNFGSLLRDFGDKAGASSEIALAIRFMPVYPALHLVMARALEDQGRHGEAIQQYQLALRVDPDCAPAKAALSRSAGRGPP